MSAPTRPSWLPRSTTWKWCRSCNKFRWHARGAVCTMAYRHADKVCECGRQCAGEQCSACEASQS